MIKNWLGNIIILIWNIVIYRYIMMIHDNIVSPNNFQYRPALLLAKRFHPLPSNHCMKNTENYIPQNNNTSRDILSRWPLTRPHFCTITTTPSTEPT